MHSHYGEDVWLKIVEDTLNFIPIVQTAADTNLKTVAVFNYQHKLLRLMQELINHHQVVCGGTIEIDEMYVWDSNKGSTPEWRLP